MCLCPPVAFFSSPPLLSSPLLSSPLLPLPPLSSSRYGVKLNDAILAEEKHQPLYAELKADYKDLEYIAGGATQNAIRVAQWMAQAPGMTTFVGCIGKDDFGATLKAAVAADGVREIYMEDESTATGTCAVLVKDNERSLVANLAAANNYKHEHFQTAPVQAALEAAQFYYIAGFFLTVSVDTILAVGQHAADNNKTFMMNLSAPFLIQFFGEPMDKALAYCDFVFANETEAQTFAKAKGWNKDDLNAVALKLAALPKASGTRPRVVVFTQGADATIVAVNGTATTFDVPKLEKDQLVDTNGAGDAFVGGFLSQLVKGKDIPACVNAGHFSARTIIQRSGCTFPAECDFKA